MELCKKELGAGNGTYFWHEDWSGNGILKDIFPDLFLLESRKMCLVRDKYHANGSTTDRFWEWERTTLSYSEKIELSCCNLMLQSVTITNVADRWRWLGDGSGTFTVGSLRRIWEEFSFPEMEYKHFWNNWVPIKVNFLGWRAVLSRLPSKKGLASRGVHIPSSNCVFCKVEEESELHLFLQCAWVKEIWASIALWCELDFAGIDSLGQVLKLFHTLLQSPVQKKVTNTITLATFWFIWKARNDAIFNNKKAASCMVVEEVKSNTFLWIKNRGKVSLSWDSWCITPFTVH
ncbi:hypothetical protein LXL04_033439 [Taraxacum kok-saghyz]